MALMPEPISWTALIAAVSHEVDAAFRRAEARRRHREYQQAMEPAHGAISKAFRIPPGEKVLIPLTERSAIHAVTIQTAKTGADGIFYVKLSPHMDIDPETGLPVFSENGWDWVGAIGSKSTTLFTPMEVEQVSVFATAPVDGVIHGGSRPKFLPS